MSVKLYCFNASDYSDCIKLTVEKDQLKCFDNLNTESNLGVHTIIFSNIKLTGEDNITNYLNPKGFSNLKHVYLFDYINNKNLIKQALDGIPNVEIHFPASEKKQNPETEHLHFDWINGFEIINETTKLKFDILKDCLKDDKFNIETIKDLKFALN